jgi:LPS export ABC transporter protein LptC
MAWQKRARVAVAIFGIASAGGVYSAIGRRQAPAQTAPLQRLDPKALAESMSGLLKQLEGDRENYAITYERQFTYDNGRTKSSGVHIKTQERGGSRSFEVTADEAEAGDNQQVLQLAGHIRLTASDGFTLSTDRAVFTRADGVVHTDSAVTFAKGRMSGRGTGATYNHTTDVLSIAQQAHVEIRDEHDALTLDFNAGAATLDRVQDLLTLDGTVHVVRNQEVIDGEHAVAHMDSEDQFITLLELRGSARVQGTGGNLDAMSARDMDLHYSADGKLLEHVALNGAAAIALTGQGGAAGKQITGDVIALDLGPDGSLTHVTANDPTLVRLGLPASEGTPARTIQARTLDATGAPQKGLTSAHFTNAVEFRELSPKPNAGRTVRAQDLQVALTDDSVSDAVFTGMVTFEEQELKATAANLRYMPDAGTLALTGSDSRGTPSVADDRITVGAETIDVTLEGRHMIAKKSVKTTLRPQPATPKAGEADDGGHLPGLLKQDQPANVNAAALDYEGASGKARYAGSAILWQGETTVRADALTIDQQKGDMVATGSAVLRLPQDSGDSVGTAYEIRYEDARRTLTYSPAPKGTAAAAPSPSGAAPAAAPGPSRGGAVSRTAAPAAGAAQPHLSGAQGDLQSDKIEVILADADSTIDRLEAYGAVTIDVDAGTDTRKKATATRMTYRAASEQYDMQGTATAPVKVVQKCSQIIGKTVTFYKSTDKMIADGQDQTRTETKDSGSCASSSGTSPASPRH